VLTFVEVIKVYVESALSDFYPRIKGIRSRANFIRNIVSRYLGAELPEDRSFGRRGQEVLQLVQTLEQLDQEIHTAETDLQALRRQAANTGAPAAWLQ